MKQALQDNSISPCLVDDYRYLNKGIPNFFDYNTMSMKNKNNDEVNVIQEYKKIYDECEVTDKIKILGNIQKYQMDMLKFRP
ncbi:hypothetical protein OUO_1505 [Helicobacter pylori R046Wa]|uniref:Uncharacterized protein n=1 Tax=Helicobacter pylori R018c TaxID=1145110 RepID=K2KVW6_HELPX|nr:hypothetical protein [Helicobacter pylori]EKE81760.1 hypothetical protein OUC_0120 [Helicobacter pylori R018c]EKE89003.1 hypothetical protein OUO_1505 [Helicobacter pylori R046Wa]EKE96144.1 hypothetical protein OUS_0208 [Helicobacter pylori R056a]